MAQFYGTTQGSRGEATRRGVGGIRSSAQSYSGSVITHMFEENGVEVCTIAVAGGSQRTGGRVIFHGPIASLHTGGLRRSFLPPFEE